MNTFKKIPTLSLSILFFSLITQAAEFPVYYEAETNVKNFVTMKTTSKEWHFDSKTRRVDVTMSNKFGTFQHSDILVNGTLYHIDHGKKTIKSRPLANEEKTTVVHEFEESHLIAAGMKPIGTRSFEGQECTLYSGNPGKTAIQNDAKASAQIKKINEQTNKVGGPSNLMDSFATIFWIRKSDKRLIRTETKPGATATTEINYRKISTNPSLFNRSLLELPKGYNRTEK